MSHIRDVKKATETFVDMVLSLTPGELEYMHAYCNEQVDDPLNSDERMVFSDLWMVFYTRWKERNKQTNKQHRGVT